MHEIGDTFYVLGSFLADLCGREASPWYTRADIGEPSVAMRAPAKLVTCYYYGFGNRKVKVVKK